MLDLIISIGIGLILGLIAGIVPGLHPNFIGILLLSSFVAPNSIFILLSMLISAQFFELIRAIFLFVPDESNVLAMHPIFKFVNAGKGLTALKLGVTGLLVALMFSIILSPILIFVVPKIFIAVKDYAPFLLLFVAIGLIIKDPKPWAAVIIFILAGAIGWFGLGSLNQPLMILLTGFFGLPILLQIRQKMPKQDKKIVDKIERGSIIKGVGSGLISSFFLTFIPAVGPAQASVFSRGLLTKTEDFIISIGAISGFDIIFSIMLLYGVGKARVGVLEIAGQYFTFDLWLLVMSLAVVLVMGVISYFLVLWIGEHMINLVDKINYKILSYLVVIAMILASFYFDNFLGIGFLLAAGGVGFAANKLQTRMSHCMGCLMVPVLIYFFF